MTGNCPSCGSKNLRIARRRSLWEAVLSVFGHCPVRCRDCGHRYRDGILWLPGISYAKCPRCLRTDLTDWEEKYYYPPQWQQALLKIGAKAHRCAVCRVNFVAFGRRKSEFVPSWKQKQQSTTRVAPGPDTPERKEQERTVA